MKAKREPLKIVRELAVRVQDLRKLLATGSDNEREGAARLVLKLAAVFEAADKHAPYSMTSMAERDLRVGLAENELRVTRERAEQGGDPSVWLRHAIISAFERAVQRQRQIDVLCAVCRAIDGIDDDADRKTIATSKRKNSRLCAAAEHAASGMDADMRKLTARSDVVHDVLLFFELEQPGSAVMKRATRERIAEVAAVWAREVGAPKGERWHGWVLSKTQAMAEFLRELGIHVEDKTVERDAAALRAARKSPPH
jgi:hypothetical protein